MDLLIKYPLPGDIIETNLGDYLEIIGIEYSNQTIIAKKFTQSNSNEKEFYIKLLIDDIKKIYYADEFNENSNQVSSDALDFIKFLSNGAKIDIKRFGVTQFPHVKHVNPSSIIKIVVYGHSESINIREFLRKCREKSINILNEFKNCIIRPFNLEELKNMFFSKKYPKSITLNDYLKFEYRKLQQGIFNNSQYFIKFLEFNSRNDFKIQSEQHFYTEILDLGSVKITGDVRDNLYWWTTPAKLDVGNITILESDLVSNNHSLLEKQNLKLDQIKQLYILDERYIENIRLLEQFEARGTIQLIQQKDQAPYLQLYIEPGANDYLKLR